MLTRRSIRSPNYKMVSSLPRKIPVINLAIALATEESVTDISSIIAESLTNVHTEAIEN